MSDSRRSSETADDPTPCEVTLEQLREHAPAAEVPIPTKNPAVLPVGHLDPEAFERLVAEVIDMRENASLHFYGRRGQAQYGLDIVEELADGKRVLYQVKRYATISPTDLRTAIKEYAGAPRPTSAELPKRRFEPTQFIVVTSALVDDNTAVIDALAELQDDYRGDLGIDLWGAEKVSRRLRDAAGLVSAVLGDAWAREFCGEKNVARARREKQDWHRIEEAVRSAMAVQYREDDNVRFRQVDLTGITVDSLFVDVPVSSYAGSPAAALLHDINPVQTGLAAGGETAQLSGHAGAAQALLHPDWDAGAVIVGGPGQGKTTLLQFVCQFHRARLLGYEAYSPVAAGLSPISDVKRVPLRIDLTAYAAWRRSRLEKPADRSGSRPRRGAVAPNTTLERFLASVIETKAGTQFSGKDLSKLIASRPTLLAFDGLDEVADAKERAEVADEVRNTQARLRANGKDALILVTTRPGSVGRPIWRDQEFAALFLGQLTPALRMKYLERWTKNAKISEEEVNDLRQTFTTSITLPHVGELAGNPMQLAILLHLMQRRAVLPERRTELYAQYIGAFLDREAANHPVVARHRDLILPFHKLLAWQIHTQVELQQSTGAINRDDLRRLLTGYLEPRGETPEAIDELFDSVTGRVLCLVQRELDSDEFQFEVQPLREYFAAEHIYDVSPNDSMENNRPGTLGVLARRPYWSNVMRFYAGKFSSGEIPAMIYMFRELQSDRRIGEHPISRSSAKLLLDDHVFTGQPEMVVKDAVQVILDGPGTVLAADGLLQQDDSVLRFAERGGAKQAVQVLLDQLVHPETQGWPAAIDLLAQLGELASGSQELLGADNLPPQRWLQSLAKTGALDATSAALPAAVDTAARALERRPLLDVLIHSKAGFVTDGLIAHCLDEMRDGYFHITDNLGRDEPYGRLAAASGAQHFYDHLRAALNGGASIAAASSLAATKPPGPASRRRVRARSTSAAWNAHVGGLESAHAQGCDWSTSGAWSALFDSVADVWDGDAWPIREGLAAAPISDLATNRERPTIASGATWREIARWRAEALENRAEPTWWETEAGRCGDQLAMMTYLAAALEVARPQTVLQIETHLNHMASELAGRRLSALTGALERFRRRRHDARELNIGESIRLNKFQPCGALTVLLWPLASESTRAQLHRPMMGDIERLWTGGPEVGAVIRQSLLASDHRLTVDQMKGARPHVPPGALATTRIKAMTYGQAQDILANPLEWPADVVRAAAEHLGRRLADMPPVSKEAEARRWNT